MPYAASPLPHQAPNVWPQLFKAPKDPRTGLLVKDTEQLTHALPRIPRVFSASVLSSEGFNTTSAVMSLKSRPKFSWKKCSLRQATEMNDFNVVRQELQERQHLTCHKENDSWLQTAGTTK